LKLVGLVKVELLLKFGAIYCELGNPLMEFFLTSVSGSLGILISRCCFSFLSFYL